jgi:Fe-S-cluster-containing hydrogenase component 2
MVTFELLCRRCKVASCVLACPFDALERREDGIIKRHNLRCVSCKSCAHACPFGTIYSELLTFYDMPYETTCTDCLAHLDGEPACVAACGQGALEYRVPDPAEKDVYIIDEYVAARVRKWIRNEAGSDDEDPGEKVETPTKKVETPTEKVETPTSEKAETPTEKAETPTKKTKKSTNEKVETPTEKVETPT